MRNVVDGETQDLGDDLCRQRTGEVGDHIELPPPLDPDQQLIGDALDPRSLSLWALNV